MVKLHLYSPYTAGLYLNSGATSSSWVGLKVPYLLVYRRCQGGYKWWWRMRKKHCQNSASWLQNSSQQLLGLLPSNPTLRLSLCFSIPCQSLSLHSDWSSSGWAWTNHCAQGDGLPWLAKPGLPFNIWSWKEESPSLETRGSPTRSNGCWKRGRRNGGWETTIRCPFLSHPLLCAWYICPRFY